MQNTLAALLPIAPVAEVMGPAVPTDGGDGLFGETFVEVGLIAEPVQKADEAAGFTLVAPVGWGGLLVATPTAPPSAEIASDQDPVPLSNGIQVQDLPVSSTSISVEGASASTVQQSNPPPKDASLSSAMIGLSMPFSTDEDLFPESALAAVGRPLEQDQALPLSTATAGSSKDLGAAWPADLMDAPPAKVTPPRNPALEERARPAAPEAKGTLAVVKGLGSEDADVAVDPEHKPTRPDASTTAANEVLTEDTRERPVDRPVPDTARASALPGRSVPAEPGVLNEAALSASPIPQATGQALADPATHPVKEQGPSPLPAETNKDPVNLDQSADPPVEDGSDRAPQVVSFWERFFSTKSAETASRTPSRTDVPLAMVVPSPGATMMNAGPGFVSEPEPESASSQATSAVGSAVERLIFPALSTAAAWSREQLVDILSKALPQMVFAEWNGDLSPLDQRAELSLSALPVTAGGAAPASPNSPVVSTHFPVPQIASQIASVLVRNESGVTELALSPEELGKIRLRMEPDSTNPDRMVILISVERPETLDLFRRHSGDLAEAIRSAGYSGADIGFGQNTQDNGSGHRREAASAGTGSRFEEIGPVETTRPHTLGASLDLRL